MLDRETVVKYLRDAIPMGEHQRPHAEFITVRLDTVQAAADAIEAFDDDKEWIEKGLVEWRDMAQANGRTAEAARATARIAIGHLQSVLNQLRTPSQQQAADSAARDWLLSIGSEPT